MQKLKDLRVRTFRYDNRYIELFTCFLYECEDVDLCPAPFEVVPGVDNLSHKCKMCIVRSI